MHASLTDPCTNSYQWLFPPPGKFYCDHVAVDLEDVSDLAKKAGIKIMSIYNSPAVVAAMEEGTTYARKSDENHHAWACHPNDVSRRASEGVHTLAEHLTLAPPARMSSTLLPWPSDWLAGLC